MAYTQRVQRIIQYIECLTVPSGVGASKPFKLRYWQKKFINRVYGPVTENDVREVLTAILSIARKNGKTALIACLVLVHLDGPEAELNGEIYSAATERDQAAIVFKYVRQMIDLEPELQENLRVVESTKTILSLINGSVYKAISAEAGSKHGFNPTVVIYDELAQAKNKDLFDALDTAVGAREQPLFIIISTQSPDPQHVLSELIDYALSGVDRSSIVELYAVPDDCEDIYDPTVWNLANPALGDFRLMRDFKKKADRAKRMPSFESTFRNLYLNQRIDAKAPLIPSKEWLACKTDNCTIEPGEEIYLALDLSGTTDLCAMVAVSARHGDRIKPWFWKPKDNLKDHEKRDRVPYTTWHELGYLDAPPGRAVDYSYVAHELAKVIRDYRVLGMAFDRWRIEILLKELKAEGIDAAIEGKDYKAGDPIPAGFLRLVSWGQGFKDMAGAVDAIETSILERKLKHDGHPVLTWNFSNAQSLSDPAGNRKLDKSKVRFRIDGAVATTMVIGFKVRDNDIEDDESDQLFVELEIE